MNASDARKAHKILDDLLEGNLVMDEEREFLRSALPELPKQKTPEEIIAHVYDAWMESSGYEWGGNSDDTTVSIEDWLGELRAQLIGLKDAPAHPGFLETEKEYSSAPPHTVVSQQGNHPWIKLDDGTWLTTGMDEMDEPLTGVGMSRVRRRVLRWGEQA